MTTLGNSLYPVILSTSITGSAGSEEPSGDLYYLLSTSRRGHNDQLNSQEPHVVLFGGKTTHVKTGKTMHPFNLNGVLVLSSDLNALKAFAAATLNKTGTFCYIWVKISQDGAPYYFYEQFSVELTMQRYLKGYLTSFDSSPDGDRFFKVNMTFNCF